MAWCYNCGYGSPNCRKGKCSQCGKEINLDKPPFDKTKRWPKKEKEYDGNRISTEN